MTLSILRHKRILNKHLNPAFYEHSNIDEKGERIRLVNYLH